jgi:hypothetical protein
VTTARAAALPGKPGGWLAIDLNSLTAFLASCYPSHIVAARPNGDMLVDRATTRTR